MDNCYNSLLLIAFMLIEAITKSLIMLLILIMGMQYIIQREVLLRHLSATALNKELVFQ